MDTGLAESDAVEVVVMAAAAAEAVDTGLVALDEREAVAGVPVDSLGFDGLK